MHLCFFFPPLQLGVQIIEICMATRDRNGGEFFWSSVCMCFLGEQGRKEKGRERWRGTIPFSVLGLMSFEDLRKRILATSGKTRQDVTE